MCIRDSHIVVREAHCSEEHEVACAAYERGYAAAEAVGDGAGEGIGDQAAEAESGDDREDAGDVIGAVGQQGAAPEGGELLLVVAHDCLLYTSRCV